MSALSTIFSQMNLWALAVSGLATFFLGGLWYSPAVMERAWMNANGYDASQVEQIQSDLGPAGFGATLLAYLTMAAVFSALAAALRIESLAGGLALGLVIWLGFVATTGLTVNLFSARSLTSWVIDAGFQLTFLLMTGAIVGAWR